MPVPQNNSSLVERASCPLLRMVPDVRLTSSSICALVGQASRLSMDAVPSLNSAFFGANVGSIARAANSPPAGAAKVKNATIGIRIHIKFKAHPTHITQNRAREHN